MQSVNNHIDVDVFNRLNFDVKNIIYRYLHKYNITKVNSEIIFIVEPIENCIKDMYQHELNDNNDNNDNILYYENDIVDRGYKLRFRNKLPHKRIFDSIDGRFNWIYCK